MTTEDQELKKAGLKVTLPRVKILQILENCADRHMTAEDIYQSLRDADEDVGIATVYRVLTQFEAAGLILISALVTFFSVIGDLVESMLKRNRKIKDSCTILPGHGGVLDRVDGLIAATPVFVLGMTFLVLTAQ